MTAYRVTIGICRAFRALVLTVSGIVERLAGGYVAGLLCLISGLIAVWHHDRAWTGRRSAWPSSPSLFPGHQSGARTIAPRRRGAIP